MVRLLLILLFASHGVAHLVGFLASWRLTSFDEMAYKTTILGGRVDLGDNGIRVMGLLWLLAASACVATAIALLLRAPWAMPAALAIAVGSLGLCLAGWPDSKIGVWVNVGLLAVLLLARVAGTSAPQAL